MGHTEHATVYTDPGAPASLVCVSARPSKQNGSTKTCVSDYPSGALQEWWGRGGGGAQSPPHLLTCNQGLRPYNRRRVLTLNGYPFGGDMKGCARMATTARGELYGIRPNNLSDVADPVDVS
jgi:hypothetical protein